MLCHMISTMFIWHKWMPALRPLNRLLLHTIGVCNLFFGGCNGLSVAIF